MKYYFDTNICIYFMKGEYPALLNNISKCHPDRIKIASIVKAELLYGACKSQKKEENTEKVKAFLFPYEVIGFDDASSIIYADMRAYLEKSGKIIGPNDLILASVVLANNGVLITGNIKEFNRVKGLKTESWLK